VIIHYGSDFSFDYHVSFTRKEIANGKIFYNYEMTEGERNSPESACSTSIGPLWVGKSRRAKEWIDFASTTGTPMAPHIVGGEPHMDLKT
jgi:predicted dithiol-disulfide oxidoreductase (DUF899 family)